MPFYLSDNNALWIKVNIFLNEKVYELSKIKFRVIFTEMNFFRCCFFFYWIKSNRNLKTLKSRFAARLKIETVATALAFKRDWLHIVHEILITLLHNYEKIVTCLKLHANCKLNYYK